jgi:MOSC domain-containing protein YiiM
MNTQPNAVVFAVCVSDRHGFSKEPEPRIVLIKGLGVEGDAHRGLTVQHLSRVKRNPSAPNLRQVHLLQGELLDELNTKGFSVKAGTIGENITTRGIDLLDLPTGARLHVGADAVVEVTGLRNPCAQLDNHQNGLTAAVLDRDAEGNLIRRAGVMAIVLEGGAVLPGDSIRVALPPTPHRPLVPV